MIIYIVNNTRKKIFNLRYKLIKLYYNFLSLISVNYSVKIYRIRACMFGLFDTNEFVYIALWGSELIVSYHMAVNNFKNQFTEMLTCTYRRST